MVNLKAFEPKLQEWLEKVVPFLADKPEEYFSKTGFLREIMQVHDRSTTENLCKQFMQFGELHKLEWPEEVPRA